MKQLQNIISLFLAMLLLLACRASDKNMNYEKTDSAHGPRIDKEHQEAPARYPSDSGSQRSDTGAGNPIPPGSTDTAKLNLQ